jgi:hypothetical protein
MRKLLPLLFLGALLVFVAGCNGANPITPESNVPTRTPTGAATVAPTQSTEAPTAPPTTPLPGSATCRVVPPIGTVVQGVPPVTADDWTIGPADAPITFIEYADFQ